MLWFVPIDDVTLPVPLPIDPTIDRFVLAAIATLWLGALAVREAAVRPRFRASPIDVWLVLIVAVAGASILSQLPMLVAVGEFQSSMKNFVILCSFVLFFYIVSTSIRPSELHAFSVLIVAVASLTSVGVMYEYNTAINVFFDWTRAVLPDPISVGSQTEDPKFGRKLITGPTSHGIAIATMLAVAIPFAFNGYLRSHITRDKVLYAIAMGLILGACFSTIRRTGAVAPAAALLVLVLYRPSRMLRLLPLGVVLVLAIQVAAPNAISQTKAQIVGGSFLSDSSAQGRTEDYGPVKVDIMDKLALGRGWGSFDPSRHRYLDNEYLARLIETGVIGLAIYVLLILSVGLVAHRAARSAEALRASVGVAIVASMAGYATANGVFDALGFPQAPYMFFFLGALAVVAASGEDRPEEAAQQGSCNQISCGPEEGAAPPAAVVSERPCDLTVIVVTHNGRRQAIATLASAQQCVHTIAAQWLIVDCGSTDGTPEAIEARWPDLAVRRLPNVGFAAANNVALNEARGRYVLLLNPDVEIVEGALDDLVLALDERPDVGAASVVQRDADGRILPSIGYLPSALRQFAEALALSRIPGMRACEEVDKCLDRYDRERSAEWLVGAFLIVRADVVRAVGGLDERFFLYSEEQDWCYRIRRTGWDIRHLPVMEIIHHCGGYDRPELRAQLTHSKILLARKHCGAARREGIRAGLVLRHAIRLIAFPLMRGDEGADRAKAELQAMTYALGKKKGPFQ